MASESEVKNYIKSILTSTPNIIFLKSINREYMNLIGTNIPFKNFGYNSIEHFLKSIPDVCIVQGTGPLAQILPCVSEKTAHIDEMVKQQRNTHAKQYNKPTRKNVRLTGHYPHRPSHSVPKPSSKKHYSYNSNYQPDKSLNYNSTNSRNYHDGVPSISKSRSNGKPPRYQNDEDKTESHSNHNSASTLKNCSLSMSVEESDKFNAVANESKSVNQIEDLVNQCTIEDDYEAIKTVPTEIQKNLKQLITQTTDAIYCYQLPRLYKEMFKKELHFERYGFTSLIDMCATLKNIFHYVKAGKDDCLLFDKNKPRPVNIDDYGVNSYDEYKLDCIEPLPPLQWSDFNFRYDILKIGEEIPRLFLHESTKEGDIHDIMVVDIYDPSKFWFNFGTHEEKNDLNHLMDELQTFYSDTENRKRYAVPTGIIEKGLYCVHFIFEEYHRARVVQILDEEKKKVKLFFFDYGTTSSMPSEGMYFLHRKFTELPAQSIRGRLANIGPEIKGTAWTRKSCQAFRQLVNQKLTKMKISYINWEEEFVCVFLADVTNKNKIVYVNELLVQEKHAVWQGEEREQSLLLPLYKCHVEKLHLFPTFLELESGFVPNNLEMDTLEDYKVPMQYIIPHYFKIIDEKFKATDEMESQIRYSFVDSITAASPRFKTSELLQNVEPPAMDFSIFGDLQDEIETAYKERHLLDNKELKIDLIDDLIDNTYQQTVDHSCVSEMNPPIKYFEETAQLSRNIIKSLESMKNFKIETDQSVLTTAETLVDSNSTYNEENDVENSSSSSSDSLNLPESFRNILDKIKNKANQNDMDSQPKQNFTQPLSSPNSNPSTKSSHHILEESQTSNYEFDKYSNNSSVTNVMKRYENNVLSIQERRKLMLRKNDAELLQKYSTIKQTENEYLNSTSSNYLNSLSSGNIRTPLRNQWWKRLVSNPVSSPSSSSETDYETPDFK